MTLIFFNLAYIGFGQKKLTYNDSNIISCSYIDFVTPNEMLKWTLGEHFGVNSDDYEEKSYGNLFIYKVPIHKLFEDTNNINKNTILNEDNINLENLFFNFLYKKSIEFKDLNFNTLNDTIKLKSYLIEPKIIYDFTKYSINKLENNIDSSKYYWSYKIDNKNTCIIGYGSKYRYSTSHTNPYFLDYDSNRKNFISLTDNITKEVKWEEISEFKQLLTEDGKVITFHKIYIEPELLEQLKVLNSFSTIALQYKFNSIFKESFKSYKRKR
jgi:hypothetical protein